MAQHNAQDMVAIAIGCAKDGIGFLKVSVDLGPAFFAARNTQQATGLLGFMLEECAIIADPGYHNAQPNPNAIVRIMRTAPAAASLQTLLGAAAGAGVGAGAGAAAPARAGAGATPMVVSCCSSMLMIILVYSHCGVMFRSTSCLALVRSQFIKVTCMCVVFPANLDPFLNTAKHATGRLTLKSPLLLQLLAEHSKCRAPAAVAAPGPKPAWHVLYKHL